MKDEINNFIVTEQNVQLIKLLMYFQTHNHYKTGLHAKGFKMLLSR